MQKNWSYSSVILNPDMLRNSTNTPASAKLFKPDKKKTPACPHNTPLQSGHPVPQLPKDKGLKSPRPNRQLEVCKKEDSQSEEHEWQLENARLKTENTVLKHENDELKEQNSELKQKNEELLKQLKTIAKQLKKIREVHDSVMN